MMLAQAFQFKPCLVAYSWLYLGLLERRDEIKDDRGDSRPIVFSQPCDLDRHVLESDSQAFLHRIRHLENLAVGKIVDGTEAENMTRLTPPFMPLLHRKYGAPNDNDCSSEKSLSRP